MTLPHARGFFSSTLNRLALFYALALLAAFAAIGAIGLMAFDRLVERDLRQTVDAERDGLVEIHRAEGRAGLIRAIDTLVDEDERREAVYLLADTRGNTLAGHLDAIPDAALQRTGWTRFAWNTRGDEVVARVERLPGGELLLTGHTTGEQRRLRDLVVRFGLGILSLLAAFTLLLGWRLRRAVGRSLQASLDVVDRFAAGALDARIPLVPGDDPLSRLARTLNRMLDRIGDLVGGIQSSTDAIAHDLRTPLTRLTARLAQARETQARSGNREAMQAVEDAQAECEQLMTTFNGLLRLARIEAPGAAPTDCVALDRIVADAVEMWQAVAESRGGTIDASLAPATTVPVTVAGDGDLLFQLLSNLLDNAIKYGPPGGHVEVRLASDAEGIRLQVRDQGPGIPAADRERVFDRFVRLERHRGSSGTGLGLSVVRAIAVRHHATLRLAPADAANDSGLDVEVRFPAHARRAANMDER